MAEVSAEVKAGFLLWPQTDSWPAIRDAAVRAERAGASSLWTWDHLMSIVGPWEGPILEGWSVLSGWAGVTERVTLGLMVGANTFRNPGLTAKLATTLDHLSGGRAILGIGGAWFEREHEAFGIDFGASVGERLDKLEEAVPLMRRLFDGEQVSHAGRFYTLTDALCQPRPVQSHLPILVGGSGPRKTLRTVARHADAWNTSGEVKEVKDHFEILAAHCADAGRAMSEIELTISFPTIIRDRVADAQAARAAQLAYNGITDGGGGVPLLLGSPKVLADTLRPYLKLGFQTVIVRMPAPFDRQTIDRLPEVLALLNS
jgi:F420-dependent oxidoreductase-like protein